MKTSSKTSTVELQYKRANIEVKIASVKQQIDRGEPAVAISQFKKVLAELEDSKAQIDAELKSR